VPSRNILAARNVAQLRTSAGNGALLAFDYDGTLAPISNDPSASRMRTETAELLRALAHAAPVAIITGRSVHDVTLRLEGIPMLAVVGNHGAEPSPFAARAARVVAAWLPSLEALVATLPDAVIEHKGQTVSVHYWHSTNPAVVVEAMERFVATVKPPATLVHGICLVNLVPRGAPDKGDALRALVAARSLPGAIFVGDELTDEPAFRAASGPHDVGIRVGRWTGSAAPWHVETQLDIDALLTELLIGCTRPTRTVAGRASGAALQPGGAGESTEFDAERPQGPRTDGEHR